MAPVVSNSARKNIRITPALIAGCEERDLKLSLDLIKVFDKQVGIESNWLIDREFSQADLK